MQSKTNILVLCNRDSDNVGDQLIEATVISLIKAGMENLGLSEDEYTITSRAASIVSRKYMDTGNPSFLKTARKAISQADVVIFGGAPLFNYKYQRFYLRTIKTLELAQEYNVPVLFSSIGVESFDPENAKSVQLKEALALACVRQITTRDDIDSLRKYVEGAQIPVSLVSDPVVFARSVFDECDTNPVRPVNPQKKTIGLVPTRVGIFHDNGIEFSEADQRHFWLDVIATLKSRGYDYRLFTTGHFSDEVFLDSLVRAGDVPASKTQVTINSPEELIGELSSCDGIIAYRLHASITAFAYKIPSVGLSWNFKVPYFYDSVGYRKRALDPDAWNAPVVVNAIEQALEEGVKHDQDFVMSVYSSLFAGLQEVLMPESGAKPLSYSELLASIPRYQGTSMAEYRQKMRRKLRRTYGDYGLMVVRDSAIVGGREEIASLPKKSLRKVKSVVGKGYRKIRRGR